MTAVTVDEALSRIGTGPFHRRLLAIFGLVWAADAMQVLAIGFAAPSLAVGFGLSIPEAVQAGTALFLGMLIGAWGFGRLADRIGRRNVLVVTVLIDAVCWQRQLKIHIRWHRNDTGVRNGLGDLKRRVGDHVWSCCALPGRLWITLPPPAPPESRTDNFRTPKQQFIEEQHPVLGQRNLARPRRRAAVAFFH